MATVEIVVQGEDRASGPLGAVSNALGGIGNIITGILGAQIITGMINEMKELAAEGLNAVASYERLTLTLQTLVAKEMVQTGAAASVNDALGMSSERAQELLQWIEQLAIKSPFTSEGVAAALRMAMAYGFTSDEAQRLTEALINFAAGSGASEDVMSRIALALGQIEAKGKLAGQEVLQLVNAGLPVTQILAEAFGVTTAEITRMQQEGLIPAKDAIEAITVYLETNFAGAAERQALSWAGLLGTFQDLKTIGLREFFGGILEVIQPLAAGFAEWLQTEGMDKLKAMGQDLGAVAAAVVDLLQRIPALKDEFTAWLATMAAPGLEGFIAGFQDLAERVAPIAEQVFTRLAELFNHIASEVGPFLTDMFNTLGVWFEENSPLISEFLTQLGMILTDVILPVLSVLWDTIQPVLSGLVDLVLNLATLLMQLSTGDWAGAASTIGDIFTGLITTIDNVLAGLINGILSFFDTSIQDIRAGIASWAAGIVTGIQSWSTSTVQAVRNWAAGVINNISGIGNQIALEIANAIMDGLNSASISASQLWAIGQSIVQGIGEGISDAAGALWTSLRNAVQSMINSVKSFLGIASPSTVFAQIGRDIIQGLINGLGAMVDSVIDTITNIALAILGPLEPILNLLGIELPTGTGTGGIGSGENGGTKDTGTPITGTTGQVVNNYFYGPVYFGQSLDDTNYDCPSPNPFIEATGGMLVNGI